MQGILSWMFSWETWWLAHTDRLVAASNFTVTAAMLILAAAVTYSLLFVRFTQQTDIRYMLIGVLMESLGWALHRFYWGLWRVYRLYGNEEVSQWFVSHGYLALIPAAMILAGLVMIIGPIISIFFKNAGRVQNYMIATALIASLYWFWWWKLGDAFETARLRTEALTKIEQSVKPKVLLDEKAKIKLQQRQ